MSISSNGYAVPQWDLADRFHKSLRTAKISITEMADYFEVHRNTISGWINGRIRPDTRTMRLWALRTGVPYEWLRHGDPGPDGDGGGSRLGESNPGPIHYKGGDSGANRQLSAVADAA